MISKLPIFYGAAIASQIVLGDGTDEEKTRSLLALGALVMVLLMLLIEQVTGHAVNPAAIGLLGTVMGYYFAKLETKPPAQPGGP